MSEEAKRRPRYFVRKVCGDWVTTDGMSRFHEYAGPSKEEALHIANYMNDQIAMSATNPDDQDYYLGIGQYAKRHPLDE